MPLFYPPTTHVTSKSDTFAALARSVSAPAHVVVDEPDLTRLQKGLVKLEQIGAPDRVDRHGGVFDRPPLHARAIPIPGDLQPDHARAKGLEQHLSIGCVVAEVGKDQ